MIDLPRELGNSSHIVGVSQRYARGAAIQADERCRFSRVDGGIAIA